MITPVLLLQICAVVLGNNDAPEVITEQGVLRGKTEQTWKGRIISAFTGIPYAKPPIGSLRFKPPVPAEKWNEILDASKPLRMCTQMNLFVNDHTVKGDEDCLYLNVYTPQLPNPQKELLPVIFNIHGGGLTSGIADIYGPKILLDKDIVLVTANYRLGSLGFITTGDEVVPGNNGLKDQNLALKWTKTHIANFRGDPNRITIFGESAGASCVHYHMLSPLSKGTHIRALTTIYWDKIKYIYLISGAIFDSNSALGVLAYAPIGQGVRNTKKLGGLLNCPTNSSQEMIECLQKIDASDIVKQDLKFVEWSYDPLTPFKAVVEPNIEGAFLVEDPIQVIKNGKAADVPIITGLTTEDGTIKSIYLYSNPDFIKELNRDFDRVAPIAMQYHETAADKSLVSKKIREFYFGGHKIDESTKSEVTNMFTDSWFLLAQDTAVRLHLKYSKKPVYYFLFGYRSPITFASVFGNDTHDYGVCHIDELLYLFNFDAIFPSYKPNESDRKMMDVMTTMWTNFAKTGNPTPKDDPLIPSKWEPVQSDKLEYYFIKTATDMKMYDNLYGDRAKFWRNLPIDPRRSIIEDEI